LIGLFLLCAAALRRGDDVAGAALFVTVLLFKHIFLYVAPALAVYLLSRAARADTLVDALLRVTKLLLVTVAVLVAAFAPLIYSQYAHAAAASSSSSSSPTSPAAIALLGDAAGVQLRAIAARLFPFGNRGLCHAYWAPNFV
jgi:alpha-1,3-glucosyltransferase